MPPISSSQKAAYALRRVEVVLRNWQDDPSSPRRDVDEMLNLVEKMRHLVQGHVLNDLEEAADALQQKYCTKSTETSFTDRFPS
ncbi:MAG: hypothetical protein H7308_03555 [Chthonomonadaceae bacterium]|nr:hypothetical protein [Chthonomonadaceae bacterium]